MCGRVVFGINVEVIQKAFPDIIIPEDFEPNYNGAPSQKIPVITNKDRNKLQMYKWGLVPFWAKDLAELKNKPINAVGETVHKKNSFREPFKSKTCLVITDGFYEWKKIPGMKNKTPFFIHMKTREPMIMAGLWDYWTYEGDELHTCTILTTTPNEMMEDLHHRMPVILSRDDVDTWLDTSDEEALEKRKNLIRPFDSDQMAYYQVSQEVGSPRNNHPGLLDKVEMNTLF